MNKNTKYILALTVEFIAINVVGCINIYGSYEIKSTSHVWFISLIIIFFITMIAWGFSSPGGPGNGPKKS